MFNPFQDGITQVTATISATRRKRRSTGAFAQIDVSYIAASSDASLDITPGELANKATGTVQSSLTSVLIVDQTALASISASVQIARVSQHKIDLLFFLRSF